MAEVFAPENEAQVVEAVQWAVSAESPVEVQSSGSKTEVGAAVSLENRIELHRLSGVVLYEPDELVLRVGPGTPLDELEEILAREGQMLPFEPPRLHGASGTIGGIVGTNLAGPRRFKAGAVRDYVIGVRGVSGFGQAFKSGGRVVKNVSGYDLSKLMTGSFGTLAALTEITLKVLPRPESEATVVFGGLEPETALELVQNVAGSAFESSAIAYLPSKLTAESDVIDADCSVTVVRLEGPPVSLDERAGAVEALAQTESLRLDHDASSALWRELRDAALLPSSGALWRVTVPPTDALSAVQRNQPDDWAIDWAGGLVWMRFNNVAQVPEVEAGGGMRVRSHSRQGAAFTQADAATARLARRLKTSFDPKGVLNPGRMGGHSA